ncbi:3-hydroxyacyl-ACP dehydratase FabZ [Thiorhodococcus fuscus]|uniref:3-hydroxyacyl-[acyl-carrier-protein] dehydratase FabZ n=1 Tax=Thiorhodococcus fuscus TaxID=527200 RepID=A0ABW4Y6J3_9GAMM
MDGAHPTSADSDQQHGRPDSVISTMDIHKVLSLLPHRYPFLLVDKVVDFKADDYLIALKNVTFNEPFFTGHFPVRPVMPGVLIVEAMAQATGLLAMASRPEEVGEKSLYYFVGIDKARFKRPVEPGDQLIMEVKLGPVRRGIWKFDGEARVDDRVVATAEIMCTARDFAS